MDAEPVMTPKQFQQIVLDYYSAHPRELPWRQTTDPYFILVSEIMLQQTQAERVVPKYEAFIAAFPTVQSLAEADQSTVLGLWSGLGYNRRALFLQRAAAAITALGAMPTTRESLRMLPGIGEYTSGAIMAFAYDQPVLLIETNIRRALLHHFFPRVEAVADSVLVPILESVLYRDSPRIWYWALMDYGSYLGKTLPNANRRSKHYTKQSKFSGSNRQLRGALLKVVASGKIPQSFQQLCEIVDRDDVSVRAAIHALAAEGFPVDSLLATLN